jgi:hypothetical protein
MQTRSEVSAQDGYEAARDRALKTTEALILAEAQVRYLTKVNAILMQQLSVVDENHLRPTDAGPVEFVCPYRCSEAAPEPCPLENCNCHLRVDKGEDEVSGDATD